MRLDFWSLLYIITILKGTVIDGYLQVDNNCWNVAVKVWVIDMPLFERRGDAPLVCPGQAVPDRLSQTMHHIPLFKMDLILRYHVIMFPDISCDLVRMTTVDHDNGREN